MHPLLQAACRHTEGTLSGIVDGTQCQIAFNEADGELQVLSSGLLPNSPRGRTGGLRDDFGRVQ